MRGSAQSAGTCRIATRAPENNSSQDDSAMPLLFPVAFSSASHHLVHVMTLARTTAGINMGRPAQLQLKPRSQVEDCSWQDVTGHEKRTWRCLSLSRDFVRLIGKRVCQSERLAASSAGDRAGRNVEEGVSYPASARLQRMNAQHIRETEGAPGRIMDPAKGTLLSAFY